MPIRFSDFSIRYKLLSGYLITIVGIVIVGAFFLYAINTLGKSTTLIGVENKKLTEYLKLDLYSTECRTAVRKFILTQDPQEEQTFNTNLKNIEDELTFLLAQKMTPEESSLLNNVDSLSDKIKGVELLEFFYARSGQSAKANDLFDSTYYSQQSELAVQINSLVTEASNNINDATTRNQQSFNILVVFVIISFNILVIAIIGIAIFLANALSNSIRGLAKTAKQIALEGNFRIKAEINSKDEIGELAGIFNEMGEKMESLHQSLEEKVEQRTFEINQKVAELEKMNRFMVDRELRMVELKEEIARLQGEKNNGG